MTPLLAALAAAAVSSLRLVTLEGQAVSAGVDAPATAVIFVSTQCPISADYNDRLSALYRDLAPRGVQFLVVAPNFTETDAEVRALIRGAEFPFPVYRDPGAQTAALLGARLTPYAVVLDGTGEIRYRGRIDDARNPARVKHHSLRQAIEELLAGKPVSLPETRMVGCALKRPRP